MSEDPYAGRKHAISHSGFRLRYPECARQNARTAVAMCNDALSRYVFDERTDLVDSTYV